MNWLVILSFYFFTINTFQDNQSGIFKGTKGTIIFQSEAPLETITATSEHLKGVIDTSSKSFAFSVAIKSFNGFNSKLQQEHFNENYMETSRFPNASFTGKIIEQINYSQTGTYLVRAKGALTIHGVRQERLIKAQVEIKDSIITVSSVFIVALKDHDISIPRVVQQKISPEIEVTVNAVLMPVLSE